MKSHELRLGNWVMGNKPYQIEIAQLVTMQYNENVGLPEYCKPMPITKDWLLKNGFKRYDYKSREEPLLFSFNNYINCYADNQDNYSTIYVSCSNDELDEQRLCRNIEHVHTFQNFYFVLAGEELSDMIAREQI